MEKELDFNQLDLQMMDTIKELCANNKMVDPSKVYDVLYNRYGYTIDDMMQYYYKQNAEKEFDSINDEESNVTMILYQINSIRDIMYTESTICGAMGSTRLLLAEDPYKLYNMKEAAIDGRKVKHHAFIDYHAQSDNYEFEDISDVKLYFTLNKAGLPNIGIAFKKNDEKYICRADIGDYICLRVPYSDDKVVSSILLSLEIIKVQR